MPTPTRKPTLPVKPKPQAAKAPPKARARKAVEAPPEKTLKAEAPLCLAAWAVVRQQRLFHIWRNSGRECECSTCLAVRALRDELVKLGIKDPEEICAK